MSSCCCSLAGTAACRYCANNPYAEKPPVVCTVQTDTAIPDYPLFKERDEKPKTNADRIRSMSDEELCDEYFRILNHELWKYTDSRAGLLDWLKREAET